MRFIAALALAACNLPCPAANAPRADDEVVSGATVDAIVAALEAQPFGEVALEWRDGGLTTATGTIEVVRGTGRRVQREDCLEECHTNYDLAMACGPDLLYVDAHGTATTADGRLAGEAWSGAVVATALDGPLEWSVSPEPIPVAQLQGSLDAREVAEIDGAVRDLGVRVFLYGTDGVLQSVSVDATYEQGQGDLASSSASALGSTPDA